MARKSPADKFGERRTELIEAAIETLADRGYARTSLRDIADNSRFSHGVLHYYFDDKVELILQCVRYYKSQCINRYDQIVASAKDPEELLVGFLALLEDTLVREGRLHRLWYDMRSQALFEERLRKDIGEIDRSLEQMVWRVLGRIFELRGCPALVTPAVAYSAIDGLFQVALLRHLDADNGGLADLRAGVRAFVEMCGDHTTTQKAA